MNEFAESYAKQSKWIKSFPNHHNVFAVICVLYEPCHRFHSMVIIISWWCSWWCSWWWWWWCKWYCVFLRIYCLIACDSSYVLRLCIPRSISSFILPPITYYYLFENEQSDAKWCDKMISKLNGTQGVAWEWDRYSQLIAKIIVLINFIIIL